MPDASAVPTAPPEGAPASTETVATTTTQTPEFTPEQYRELESKYAEATRTLENANVFFNQDQEVRERLQLFTDAYKQGKPYSELLAGRASKSTTQEPPKKSEGPVAPSEDQIRQIIQAEINKNLGSTLSPVNDQLAMIQGERDAQNILKENTWATQKDVTEFENRLTKAVQERAQKDVQANWPRLSNEDGMKRAWDYFSRFETNDLFVKMMQDKRDAWVMSGRRPAPTLAPGMKDEITEGIDPGLDAKFKAAIKGAEGDSGKIAELVREYAPQFGVDPDNGKDVMAFYKKLVR